MEEITLTELLSLLEQLTDEEDCHFDCKGHCQAHGWFYTDQICPNKRAKNLLTAKDQTNFRLVINIHDQI